MQEKLEELYALGFQTLSIQLFTVWLNRYNPELGKKPYELLEDPEGIDVVKDHLIKVDISKIFI